MMKLVLDLRKQLLEIAWREFYSSVARSFVELTRYLFTLSGVKVFLSQRGATNENPNVLEFYRNTQAL